MKKANRIWAQRSEAVALLAEHADATGVEIVAMLFHSQQETLKREAQALTAAVLQRKQEELKRAQQAVAKAEQTAKKTA